MSNDPTHPPLLCPICKRPVDESDRNTPDSPFPFCSSRCKLIDLGRWLGGKYQIPVVEEDESDTPEDASH
jgi:endogenous inhibitor of DNA gyrase (YacG/DUF329 family)